MSVISKVKGISQPISHKLRFFRLFWGITVTYSFFLASLIIETDIRALLTTGK